MKKLLAILIIGLISLNISVAIAEEDVLKEVVKDQAQIKTLLNGFEQVQIGMMPDEVKNILGKPYQITKTEVANLKIESWQYRYQSDSIHIIDISFQNGKVDRKTSA